MPMIALTTTEEITTKKETALRAGFGKAIALLPGKSEAHLMLSFADYTPMAFKGEVCPAAFVDVSCFGATVDASGAKQMTQAVCDLLQETLGLDPANVYIKYSATELWGHNGSNL